MSFRRSLHTTVRRAAFAAAALGAVAFALGTSAPSASAAQPLCLFGVNRDVKPDCGPIKIPTYSSLASSANPSTAGQAVTFTFSVAGNTGTGTPTGDVTFGFIDSVTQSLDPVATSTLTNGTTTWTPTSLPVGTDGVYAAFAGDFLYDGIMASYYEQVIPAAPVVQSIAPKKGPAAGGTTVTVTGENLDSTTAIMVGALPATSFSCASSTTCTLVTPAQTGRQQILVTNSTGTSPAVKTDRFGYRLPKP